LATAVIRVCFVHFDRAVSGTFNEGVHCHSAKLRKFLLLRRLPDMKKLVLAAALALGAAAFAGPAAALPAGGVALPTASSDVQQAQFIFGGRNYCWYDAGWHGPGFYWCGYAFRRGLGWGGGHGWHGWHRGGGHVVGRPGGGRPHVGRPGGGRPSAGRPGGGRPGGGRPGGGHGGGHHR